MKRPLACVLVIALAAAPVFGQGPSPGNEPGRKLKGIKLASVVFVSSSVGPEGSGFYLITADSQYFITAGHVIFDPDSGDLLRRSITLSSFSGDPAIAGEVRLSVDLTALLTSGALISHGGKRDIAVLRVGRVASTETPDPATVSGTIEFENGVRRIDGNDTSIVGLPMNNVGRFRDAFVGNSAITFGFPTSLGLKAVPMLDLTRPLLRSGVVAGLNMGTRTIVVDIPVYPGNSGGPVVQLSDFSLPVDGKVIGVVIAFVPIDDRWLNRGAQNFSGRFENSGYSIVEPLDSALDLIDALERADAAAETNTRDAGKK